MAKVVAPLQSFSASGKIGKSIVFGTHLGRNVVRGLVTPQNPKTETQGDQRLMLGGIGRSSKAAVVGRKYQFDANQAVPAGQTWNSMLIKNILATYGSGSTGLTALDTEFSASTATNWETEAAALGLTSVTIAYAGAITEFTGGMQLFVLAKNAFVIKASNPTLFARAPYTDVLSAWDNADVTAFAGDLSAAL